MNIPVVYSSFVTSELCQEEQTNHSTYWSLLRVQVYSETLSSSDFKSYSTTIAVKFLVYKVEFGLIINIVDIPGINKLYKQLTVFIHFVLPDFEIVRNLDF